MPSPGSWSRPATRSPASQMSRTNTCIPMSTSFAGRSAARFCSNWPTPRDVVLHLAPVEAAAPGSAGINGLVHVAHAAARAGSRLIYVSQSAGQPKLYRQAETLVTSGWAPSLVVRIAPPVGRQLDWMICRTVGSLLASKDSAQPLRLLHFDDLLRFLVLAVATNRTGRGRPGGPGHHRSGHRASAAARRRPAPAVGPPAVLAAADARTRRRRGPRRRGSSNSVGGQAMPSPTRCADLAGRSLDALGAVDLPGHLPLPVEVAPRTAPPDGTLLSAAPPDGQEGEFDDRIDPRFPVFSAATVAETLPGPLTPMTLDVQLSGLRAATATMSRVMAAGDVVADEWGSRAIAVFSHRPYVGVSASVIAAEQLPGWDADEVRHAVAGRLTRRRAVSAGAPAIGGPAARFGRESGCRQTGVGVAAASEGRHPGLRRGGDGRAPRCGATDVAVGRRTAGAASAAAGQDSPGLASDRAVADRQRRHRGDGGAHRPARRRLRGGRVAGQRRASTPRPLRWPALIRNDAQLCALALDRDLDGISVLSRTIGAAFDVRGQPGRAPRARAKSNWRT